jgi:flagellar secretion chaperone FliS
MDDPKLSYREAAVQGASPVRLVVLLYEQAIADIRRALAAHESGQIEQRTRHINHAILVLGYLEASLDKQQGREVARHLERFYHQIRAGLIAAQLRQSAIGLQQQLTDLMEVRQAWNQVDEQNAQAVPTPSLSEAQISGEADLLSGWRA